MRWRHSPSMWDEAVQLLEHADRLHRQFFQLEDRRLDSPSWAPPVDVFETEDQLLIIAALPGVSSEQLLVSIEEGAVVIRGRRSLLVPDERAAIRRLEIPYGQFERRIALPAGRFRTGQRLLKDGCLMLALSKLD